LKLKKKLLRTMNSRTEKYGKNKFTPCSVA
jgi:hypothetical protein